jgi:uncharacterized protein
MTSKDFENHDRLIAIAHASSWFMSALAAARSLRLRSWCIGAGAVRNLVWDHLHGYSQPTALSDIDVAYFDDSDLREETDQLLQAALSRRVPELPWEVTNQAGVHIWFERYFGHSVSPLRSLEESIASWPEYATSVGITLEENGSLTVLAPFGLDDLFSMRIQRNPSRVSITTYRQRIAEKRYLEKWPRVTVVPS